MQTDVIMAGFGGQGVLSIGKMLAYAGLKYGKEVSWLPAYGPEMRGGTANCTVVVSDEPVGSPVVEFPQTVVAMNLPSLDKFEPQVKVGGLLLINTSLIEREAKRQDVRVLKVAANDIAKEVGNTKAANMVVLGAYVGATQFLPLSVIDEVMRESFAHKPEVIKTNVAALERGFSLGQTLLASGLSSVESA